MKVMELDLGDFNSVQSFADKVKSEIPTVDILILNAGVGFVGNLQFSKDGHEITLQTNYLSNALLVLELLPHLQQSALQTGTQTKITWLGSRSAYESNLARNLSVESSIFQHMDDPKNYSVKDRYADTKLLSYIFMSTLAKRLSSSPSLSLDDDTSNDKNHNNQMGFSDRNTESVIINMVCPGLIATDFTYKHLPLWAKLLVLLLLFLVARTVEQGVWSIINAVAVAGAESHGEFLLDKDVKAVPPFLLTPNGKRFRQQVWKETMMQIGKIRTTRTSPKST
jgi:NAD(P)-dependent dehydrogenase (short-subunit alcohol dehydrogenase family)